MRRWKTGPRRLYYARALRELWRNRRGGGVFLTATAAQGLANGVMATCAGLIGQALVGRQVVGGLGVLRIPWESTSPLVLSSIGLISAIVKATSGALSIYGRKKAAFRVGDAIRLEVTDRMLRRGRHGASAAEAQAGLVVRLRDVERGVDEGMLAAAQSVATLAPLAVALLALAPHLALGALLVLAPFGAALSWARRRFRARHARAARLAEKLHAGLDELVRHVDLWRSFGAEARVRAALARSGRAAGHASARVDAGRAALSGANEVLGALALVALIAWSQRAGLGLDDTPVVAFCAVFFLTYRPLRDLGDARAHIDRGAEALAELDALVAPNGLEEGPPADSARARPPVRPWKLERLTVRGVHGERAGGALGTSFTAEPGEIVAIIGPTGAGKTSLLRALLGLDASAGSIRYGAAELSEAGVGPTQRPFAWVPQEPAIVSGSIEENVALAAPEGAGREAARDALEAIGAGELLTRRAGAALGAGGPELSGGERQWIAIARAMGSGLPVLLLDEPTSGLDGAAQERVMAALRGLRGSRTILIVTHRTEPLAIADRIVELDMAPTPAAAAE